MKKKPWLAAVLNILLVGLGYIYVGKRILFGALLIIGEVLSYVWLFTDSEASLILENPWVILSGVFYIVAFAIDGYKCAKEV